MQTGANPEHVPLPGQASQNVIRDGITVLQLNVEGLTKAKISIIELINHRNLLPSSFKKPT